MFDTVLIANRGENALCTPRVCRMLDLRTVAICSEADRDSRWLQKADQILCIGPAPAGQSYLDHKAILYAARETRAGAVHPGYGSLSENAAFAEKVEAAGLVVIGSTPQAIRQMGDTIAAKQAIREARVPCLPCPSTPLFEDRAEVRALAEALGFPVIAKAAGSGGQGIRVVHMAQELDQAAP